MKSDIIVEKYELRTSDRLIPVRRLKAYQPGSDTLSGSYFSFMLDEYEHEADSYGELIEKFSVLLGRPEDEIVNELLLVWSA
ncbi:hypothetical protein DYI42_23120 [Vannielia litorea]|nr:hypothetical protein [Vannielia litorea]